MKIGPYSLKAIGLSILSARRWAAFALLWERLWPLLLPLFCMVSLFLAVSWLGLWGQLPETARLIFVTLFGLGTVACLWPLRRFTIPTLEEIDHRIESRSGLNHRPLTSVTDKLADVSGSTDSLARALWQEHQSRMAQQLHTLSAGIPSPSVAKKDPLALRAVFPLLLFIGFLAGWGNWLPLVKQAFEPAKHSAALSGRIDAWVKPAAYTNRPPIFLSRSQTAQPEISQDDAPFIVPEGSELVVRSLGFDQVTLNLVKGETRQEIAPASAEEAAKQAKQNGKNSPDGKGLTSQAFAVKLQENTTAELKSGNTVIGNWTINVLPDADPQIAFEDLPEASNRGTLEFSYSVKDDYGIASARAMITSRAEKDASAEPLIDAPDIQLPLPGLRTTDGSAKVSQDLTAHPWAGAKVTMELLATDEAGQTGKSKPHEFTLPQRIFTKPLALALVDERRRLAMDARMAPKVAQMLDIITTTHPDEFIKDLSTFTALRVIVRSVSRNKDKEQLRDALELMWQTALAIEDGDLSLAERRLRDAQERLARALENGASEEEISELMKELRQAMNDFMRELAQQSQNQNNQQAMPFDENTQVLRQQDLERMMQQIEDLAKSGSRDAARQLLQELQRMMNNLQTARPSQQQQQQNDQFGQQMDQLGEMMRQQQQLMDRTFDMQRRQQQLQQGQQLQNQRNRSGQNGQQGGQQQGSPEDQQAQSPMTPEEFAEAMRQLQEQQGDLQRQMQELQDALKGLGMEPGQLGKAGEAMGEAEDNLQQGEPGPATGNQGRALQAMREGAQQMMQQMQNQAGEQGRRGERGQHGQQTRDDRDPLGRQTRSNGPQLGNDTKVPSEIDAQRAREILKAIRRKLGEAARPRLELDYLDRLLPTR